MFVKERMMLYSSRVVFFVQNYRNLTVFCARSSLSPGAFKIGFNIYHLFILTPSV